MNYSKRTWEKQVVTDISHPPPSRNLKSDQWRRGGGEKKVTKDLQVPSNMMLHFFGSKLMFCGLSGGVCGYCAEYSLPSPNTGYMQVWVTFQ